MKKSRKLWIRKIIKKLKPYDTEIDEYKFYQHNSPILINKIDINKIVKSITLPFGKQDCKYFIGYEGDKKVIP